MPTQSNKQLLDQLQLQLTVANKIAKQLEKALGYNEATVPVRESVKSKAAKIIAKHQANNEKRLKKQSANH